ncbi:hypothetical protein [Rhodococcus aetherivorans]|uniref:hypothetical protein n=1 Tax=Rhodococcus aetherivorans TaxID=191292 RepID=UPI003B8A6511
MSRTSPSGPSGSGTGCGGSATSGSVSITSYTRSTAARESCAMITTENSVRVVAVIVAR